MAEPGILFAAFEPSGDRLAGPVIEVLRRRLPDVPLFALGGPRMRAAGAKMIETTTEHAVMFAGAAAHWRAHRRRVRQLRGWLESQPLAAFVPVDSPAANWSICQAVRDVQPVASIVHLAAPQLWAWAAWRIHRLRRLTDHVLCMLPFEPAWFEPRGVKATFIGHPIFAPTSSRELSEAPLPEAPLRLALLPGSRQGEIVRNWPTMLAVFEHLRASRPQLAGVVAAVDEQAERWIRQASGRATLPPGLVIVAGQTDAVLGWADAALVVSGTATLQAAARGTPMVALFNVHRATWYLVGVWLLRTRSFTLPNLIAQWQGGGRVLPEFVPHFGQVEPVTTALATLLDDAEARAEQRRRLARAVEPYLGLAFAEAAADHILAAGGWPT